MHWHHRQYWAVQSQELSIYVKWYADSCPYGPSTEAVIIGEGWNDKPFWGCSEVLEILSLSFLVHSPRTFIRIERWCFPSRGLEETLKGCHWSQDNSLTWRNIKLRALYRISVTLKWQLEPILLNQPQNKRSHRMLAGEKTTCRMGKYCYMHMIVTFHIVSMEMFE